jgi:VanZ family protein
MNRSIYRIIFWTGYVTMIVTAMLPLGRNLSRKKVLDEIRLDYFLHALVYFAICMYFQFGIKVKSPLFRGRPVIKFTGVMIFLAVTTEIVQLVVPSRSFSYVDLGSDLVGTILGMLVIVTSKNRINSKNNLTTN